MHCLTFSIRLTYLTLGKLFSLRYFSVLIVSLNVLWFVRVDGNLVNWHRKSTCIPALACVKNEGHSGAFYDVCVDVVIENSIYLARNLDDN